jgi:hypothetical protein
MNNLSHVADKLIHFFDLEGQESELLLQEVEEIIASTEKEEIINDIRNNFPQISFSGIGQIYEVLAKNPERWGDFYVEEIKRAYLHAERSDAPFPILDCLEELSLIKNKNQPFGHQVIEFLAPYLNHEKPVFRFKALYHLGDWMEDGNQEKFNFLIYEIQKKLKDDNWQVRYVAELVLKDLNAVPNNYTPSLFDKMQRKFTNPFSFS